MVGGMASASRARRRWHHRLILVWLALFLSTAQAAEEVHSARYGVALFYYFQQDYFNALTELMAAQQLDELGVQAQNAELCVAE